MAPIVANKRADLLEKLIQDLTKLSDFCEKWPPWICFPVFWKMGHFKKNNLGRIVWGYLNEKERIVANTKCRLVAWNMNTRQDVWFGGSTRSTDILEGMTASSNLWLLVPPFKGMFLDGGARNLYPIQHLLNVENANLKVLFIDSSTRASKPNIYIPNPKNAIELMYNLHDAVIDELGVVKLEKLKLLYGKNVEIIRPLEDIFESNVDFDREKIMKTFQEGRQNYIKNESRFFARDF
jgi:hypothetical protein